MTVAKEREKALKQAQKIAPSPGASRGVVTPSKGSKKTGVSIASGSSTPARKNTDQQQFDIAGLNLNDGSPEIVEEIPKMSLAKEKVIEEAKQVLEDEKGKKGISIVVIG